MQFQVPQNIDLEDKIVGPLTLKQFLYLLVGGMLDYAWYTFFDTSLFILMMIPTTLFALAMAFARVQDQPFPKFLGSLIIFVIRPKILIWGKSLKPKIIEAPDAKKEKIIHPKFASESQIQKLAQIIDTQGWNGSTENQPAMPGKPGEKKPVIPLKKRESFIEKIIQSHEPTGKTKTEKRETVIQPQIAQPQAKDWRPTPANSQIVSSEELEKELNLGERVKSHEAVKAKVNLGAASENNPEDVLDIVESSKQQTGKKR